MVASGAVLSALFCSGMSYELSGGCDGTGPVLVGQEDLGVVRL